MDGGSSLADGCVLGCLEWNNVNSGVDVCMLGWELYGFYCGARVCLYPGEQAIASL